MSHRQPIMSGMGLLMNLVAGVAGVLMVVIGVYSMVAIWWDELD
ncbi:MAG: hypothetical protein WD895_00760 [Acidimicrobiia bacterium]